jgi:uncharacterized protein YutE (UPF0331/DUF86 family)
MEIKKPEDYGLVSSNLQMDAASNIEVAPPFDLKAEDFLSFAEQDIEGCERKDIINAISNAKRAIENRVDHLLFAFGYPILEEKWDFPTKLEILNKVGIIAPRILRKINKIRNLLEHQYKLPNKDEVEDAIDVAILFLESTKKFIYDFVDEYECYDEEKHVAIKFVNHKEIAVEIVDRKSANTFSLNHKEPTFCDWLKFIIETEY